MSAHDDLRRFASAEGPFLTITLPIPSHLDDAQHRFDTRWKNARREIDASEWGAEALAELDALVSTLPHDGGAGLVIARAGDGTTLVEFLDEPVRELVDDSVAPRLAPVIEARQRALAHIVVETDRSGADIHAFDGGRVLGSEQVDGDTTHIHRGHAGGWSQRRYQQRAENTWERNADDVADAIAELDRGIAAELVVVAGDVRARHLVTESLPEATRAHTTMIEAGSPGDIADEVVRLVSDRVARDVRGVADDVRDRVGSDLASLVTADVLDGLDQGRVERLLVHDDASDEPVTDREHGGVPAGARVVDAAIISALRTDAEITVVPRLAMLDGPIAALYRW
jgi:hypothetical protein